MRGCRSTLCSARSNRAVDWFQKVHQGWGGFEAISIGAGTPFLVSNRLEVLGALGVNLGMAVPYPMVALVRFLPIVAEAPVFTASFWPDSTFACFTPFEPSHGWWSRRRSGMGWAMHLLSLSLLNPLDRFTRMAWVL